MASYLVTGGAGFIGSHLAEELVRRKHRVRVADNLVTGKRCNLDHLDGVEFLEGDLVDPAFAARAVDGMETCFIKLRSRPCRGPSRTRSRPTARTSTHRSMCSAPRATRA